MAKTREEHRNQMVPSIEFFVIMVRTPAPDTFFDKAFRYKFYQLTEGWLSGEMNTFVHGILVCGKTNLP